MKEDTVKKRSYIAIDLKSFYASAECAARGVDPMTTNLVVADPERTAKTICLAVSPSMKELGIPGRPRLFEVIQKMKEVNALRLSRAPGRKFAGRSFDGAALSESPDFEADFIVAPPRMAEYVRLSAKIYDIYLRHIAPEDIHVYSIDEVFIDATDYLASRGLTARALAETMIRDVLKETGITATAGIGTNLYLAKIAMDIVAKHMEPDEDGVRIAELDEMTYRRKLWTHRPITDFWRVGRGYAKKLASVGLYTMGDIALCSEGRKSDFHNEDLLYRLFGVNGELLIDHAWGYEPCTMADIKKYRPSAESVGSGQVLMEPYPFDKARTVTEEMVDSLALDLASKGLVTNQIVLTVGYDRENLEDPERRRKYKGEIVRDGYGRLIPKHAHGTANLKGMTSSSGEMLKAVTELFDRIVNPDLTVRRITVAACHVTDRTKAEEAKGTYQLSFFDNPGKGTGPGNGRENEPGDSNAEKDGELQKAMTDIKKKFGKNAVVRGISLEEGATGIRRNNQIGGHRA